MGGYFVPPPLFDRQSHALSPQLQPCLDSLFLFIFCLKVISVGQSLAALLMPLMLLLPWLLPVRGTLPKGFRLYGLLATLVVRKPDRQHWQFAQVWQFSMHFFPHL